MASNLVVVGYRDGRREKGSTFDFVPTKGTFHLEAVQGGVHEVRVAELKAIYFVKDLEGNADYETINEFTDGQRPPGRKIRVVFEDDEELLGTTQGYAPERQGFFVVPADANANNSRVFVLAGAVRRVEFV